jgi:hypothetical protein
MTRIAEWLGHLEETGNADLSGFGFVIERDPRPLLARLEERGVHYRRCSHCGERLSAFSAANKRYCNKPCMMAASRRRASQRQSKGDE